MPFTPDEAKPPLLDDVADIQKQQALWVLLGATLGGGTTAVLGPFGLVISGVAALLVYVLEITKSTSTAFSTILRVLISRSR